MSAALALVAMLSGTSVRAQSLVYEAYCPVIFAYNVTSGYYVETSLPGGVCSFPANSQIVFRSESAASTVEEPTDACYGNGRYYCFYSEYNWMIGYVTQLRIYDVDTEATPGQHTYYVTSLWEEGESTISNRVTVDVTAGIQQLTMPSASRHRYDLWGRIIPEGVNPRGIVIR